MDPDEPSRYRQRCLIQINCEQQFNPTNTIVGTDRLFTFPLFMDCCNRLMSLSANPLLRIALVRVYALPHESRHIRRHCLLLRDFLTLQFFYPAQVSSIFCFGHNLYYLNLAAMLLVLPCALLIRPSSRSCTLFSSARMGNMLQT